MPSTIRTSLSLPVDVRLQRLVLDYVRGLAQLAGFLEEEAECLALAVWDACRNSIEQGFEIEDSSSLKLVGKLTPVSLVFSIYDKGLPFYQGREPTPVGVGSETPAEGRLSHQRPAGVQQCFDKIRWVYHGVKGNELRLVKYRTGVCCLPDMEPPPSASPVDRAQPALPGAHTIRLLRPEDGIQIARLMYRVYGYSYPIKDFYYPDRLQHRLTSGRYVGVVAATPHGEIVGHGGMDRPDLGPLGKLGALVVAPAHRRRGLGNLMIERLQAEIMQLGLVGLFCEAVTSHTSSQKVSDRLGHHVTCIKLLSVHLHYKTYGQGLAGAGGRTKKEVQPASQRQTTVFYFKYLAPVARKTVYAPRWHREMLAGIYRNLETDVEFCEPQGPAAQGELQVHFDQVTKTGIIQVDRAGEDIVPVIQQARHDLCVIAEARVVGLLLPLAQAGTPRLCRAAEEQGFFFSGVMPHFAPDGDFLRLQYLNAELRPERIHVSSAFARELLGYILEERERVGG
ncbi:MAG: GNAT family N-acetyltransferase [Syntrophobacteraceae bacterium]|nr:GNAT family N-acetyltransferase [Syntrophobacteraceae bacterium]